MSDLLYRKSLAEKLKDLSGELKTGRDSFTWNSGLYNKLNKSINAVLKVLDDHSGEEWLSDEVKKDLEDKIKKMKDAAIPYSEEKLRQGALADGGLSSRSNEAQYIIRKRFQAAIDILKVDSKIPNDPGFEEGIVRPDVPEEGDQLETDWRLKWSRMSDILRRSRSIHMRRSWRNIDLLTGLRRKNLMRLWTLLCHQCFRISTMQSFVRCIRSFV